ncbi:hypothetical protein Ancab_013510 [Ancistrocladus abbreviatus]
MDISDNSHVSNPPVPGTHTVSAFDSMTLLHLVVTFRLPARCIAMRKSIKKQYCKFALLLCPDKNKFAGAKAAFKLKGEAQRVLLDKDKRSFFDIKHRASCKPEVPNCAPQQANRNVNVSRQSKIRNKVAVLNRALRCRSCKKPFIAYDTCAQGVPPGAYVPHHPFPKDVPNQGTGNPTSRAGFCGSSSPQKARVESFLRSAYSEQVGGSRKVNGRRGKKQVKESSESCDSGGSLDSEEGVGTDQDSDVLSQGFRVNGPEENLDTLPKEESCNSTKPTEGSGKREYPDPDFSNFDEERKEECFTVGQIWVVYDTIDAMPRFYAWIRKVFSPGFKLRITWLKPDTDNDSDFEWVIPACLTSAFEYDFVKVLSEYDGAVGICVVYLGKLKGFASLFCQIGEDEIIIPPSEVLRFFRRVPSFKMTGEEREDVPTGSFELDPASISMNLEEIMLPIKAAVGLDNVYTNGLSSESLGGNCVVEGVEGRKSTHPHLQVGIQAEPVNYLDDVADDPNLSPLLDVPELPEPEFCCFDAMKSLDKFQVG